MLANKYSTFLTVLLVIIVVCATGGLIYLGVRMTTAGESPEDAVRRFEENVMGNRNIDDEDEIGDEELVDIEGEEGNMGNTNNGQRRNNVRPRQYYQNHVMVGTINIPRTNTSYPILERGTNRALDLAVAVMWPNNPEDSLNEPGNVVIMGHNYRNGRFFSDNARLNLGDSIIITDTRGRRVTYIIYQIFETAAEDTTYITRDTEGAREITLTTCTDDSIRRLVIKARAAD